MRLYNSVYQKMGIDYCIETSVDGYDEISLTTEFKVATSGNEKIYTPESLSFSRYQEADLYGGDTPEDAARIFNNVLKNKATSAQRDVVIANSAFAIQVIESQKSIFECIDMAKESLESGKALQVLNKFVELNS